MPLTQDSASVPVGDCNGDRLVNIDEFITGVNIALERAPLERCPAFDVSEKPAAWELRHHVTAYDALYVTAARQRGAALITADGPRSRAPALGIVVHNVRLVDSRGRRN